MKKLTFTIIAASQLLLTGLYAQTTTLTYGALESSIGDASNAPLPNPDLVLAGTFKGLTPAQVAADAAAVANGTFAGGVTAFYNDFTTFDSTMMAGTNVGNTPGFFSAVSPGKSATALGIVGSPVYYFVFNSSSEGSATQYGIFTGVSGNFASQWTFQSESTPVALVTDIGDVPQNSNGIMWGSYNVASNQYDLAPIFTAVPEPSTYASTLLGLSGLGLVAVRRRYKK